MVDRGTSVYVLSAPVALHDDKGDAVGQGGAVLGQLRCTRRGEQPPLEKLDMSLQAFHSEHTGNQRQPAHCLADAPPLRQVHHACVIGRPCSQAQEVVVGYDGTAFLPGKREVLLITCAERSVLDPRQGVNAAAMQPLRDRSGDVFVEIAQAIYPLPSSFCRSFEGVLRRISSTKARLSRIDRSISSRWAK